MSLAILMLLLAASPEKPSDLAALDGTWKPTMARRGLQNMGDHILEQERWKIKDGKYTMKTNLGRYRKYATVINTMQITLDPTKSPKHIDIKVIDGPEGGRSQWGIYEINGDELKICWGRATRPTKFEWKEDDASLYLVTFKRIAK